ncbi:MAG: DNA gyrase subunit A, partial [Phototrophicaceae bacterium]
MNIGDIQPVNIEQEMRDSFLDYAMSVIVSRALPDARDGLKPVHRRILYAMHDMGLNSSGSHKKSARIVGEVLGKYHPHGDQAVYDAMARLAQDFSLRYMLVDGQGNFGSIDGDSPAAMRYTEAKMATLGEALLSDIEKETVKFVDNFDGSLTEPSVLPSALPNLLVNGASGIAVGMSTSIPPHNLGEVVNALVYMLGKWDDLDDITVEELMHYIKGPDFPTGGVIYSHKDTDNGENPVLHAYATGRGKIILRAKVHIEDMGRGKSRIIVSELPYQANKSTIIERIASRVASGKLEGLADMRDESDRQNQVRLMIELQRGADATAIMADLFKYTPLQETFSIIMLALVDGQPRILSLKQCLRVYLEHRMEIVRKRSEFDLARAKERAHILEGILIALDNLDEVIAIIRKSRTAETARTNLMKEIKVSEVQAQAILDMQLRRLASLERKKVQDEHDEKMKIITSLETLLADPKKVRTLIMKELTEIKQEFNDPRRTIIASSKASSLSAEDFLMPEEPTWVVIAADGKIGRTFKHEPPSISTKLKNPPRLLMDTNTAQVTYLFTKKGTCATIPVQQLPQINDVGEGIGISDISALSSTDEVIAGICLPNSDAGFIFFATAKDQVKRIRMEDLPGMSSQLFSIMNVDDDDELIAALVTDGEQHIMLSTRSGQTIRFNENDVRPMGLNAGGVRGIKLQSDDDRVVSAFMAEDGQYVFSISDDGVAKISPCEEYPVQGRAGQGVINMRLPSGSEYVAATAIGRQDDNIIVVSSAGKPLYMRIGRAMMLKRGRNGGDFVISMREGAVVSHIVSYQPKLVIPEPTVSD